MGTKPRRPPPPHPLLSSFLGCLESGRQETPLLAGKAVATNCPRQANKHPAAGPRSPRKPYLDNLRSLWLNPTEPKPS